MFFHYVHNNFILLTWSKALLAIFVCVQTQRGHWTSLVDHQGGGQYLSRRKKQTLYMVRKS